MSGVRVPPGAQNYTNFPGGKTIKTNKIIGSALISVGTSIGAGILALPMVGASSGLISSSLLIIGVWLLITISSFIVLEVNLTCPSSSCSFDAMAQKTLGKVSRLVVWITLLCLHYALLAAYSSGASTLLSDLFSVLFGVNIPTWLTALLFVGALGSAVFWSTAAVDYTNRIFISAKGVLLIASILLLMPHIDFVNLFGQVTGTSSKYLAASTPIFLGAFGFLATIPSLRLYVGERRKELRLIIICSTTISLIIYLLWLLVNLGIVPVSGEVNSFATIKSSGNSVAKLIDTITTLVQSSWVTTALRGFANISMTTSFLGVALGLFDFLADGCKRADNRLGRLQTAALTFVPPLAFAIFYPKGFIIALSYAAIFMAILEIICPALMAYQLQKNKGDQLRPPSSSIFYNKFLLIAVIIAGVTIVSLAIMDSLHLLPVV